MNLLLVFIILTALNVVLSTIKSIITVKGSPFVAASINAFYYGFYNIVLIFTVADFPMWQKVLVTFCCNLIGVYVVKYVEAKNRKDRLWKVECTVPKADAERMLQACKYIKFPYNYIDIQKYVLFNFYCSTQEDSREVKQLLSNYNAKYFVNEQGGEL